MLSIEETRYLFHRSLAGDDVIASECRVWPALDADNTLASEHGDGENVIWEEIDVVERRVRIAKQDTNGIWQASRPEVLFRNRKFDLHLTDSRMILESSRPAKDGKITRGQIRFPWIRELRFSEREAKTLQIRVDESITDPGWATAQEPPRRAIFEHTIIVHLAGITEAESLAGETALRVGKYTRETQGAPWPREAARTPTPSLGEDNWQCYTIPTYCNFPEGFFQLGDSVGYPQWISTVPTATPQA